MAKKPLCPKCAGTGTAVETCRPCDGLGKIWNALLDPSTKRIEELRSRGVKVVQKSGEWMTEEKCYPCNGKGERIEECPKLYDNKYDHTSNK